MKRYFLQLILLIINVFSPLQSEKTIQEVDTSKDGKYMTIVASGLIIVRF